MSQSTVLSTITAVIIAGGKGTRLGLPDLPKPMAPLLGKPLLAWQIDLLQQSGVRNIIILGGYLGHKIVEYFGDGTAFGVQIRYVMEDQPLGTAGAMLQVEADLKQDFLVLYGDVFVDMDLQALLDFHERLPSAGTLVVHPNDHPHDSDLVDADPEGFVKAFLSKPHPAGASYKNLVNAALYVLSPQVFDFIPRDRSSDFGKDVFPAMVTAGVKLRAYSTPEYLKDMGTPQRLESVAKAVASGKTARRNLKHKQKAIFLDRDGIINREIGGVLDSSQFELLDGIVPALKAIHQSDYLAIVVTNQPFIAKGQLSFSGLDAIHARMDTLLGLEGTFVDALYFCPHHPEKGWEGEVVELKIDCECRKPAPGMLYQAAKDFNIDLQASYILGDRTHDTLSGMNVGLKGSLLIGAASAPADACTGCFSTVMDAVTAILEGNV